MQTFLVLFTFTEQGIRNIKNSSDRIEQERQVFETYNAKVLSFYSLLGRFDTMYIVQAPDEKVMTDLVVHISAMGNMKCETLRAFTFDEYCEILNKS